MKIERGTDTERIEAMENVLADVVLYCTSLDENWNDDSDPVALIQRCVRKWAERKKEGRNGMGDTGSCVMAEYDVERRLNAERIEAMENVLAVWWRFGPRMREDIQCEIDGWADPIVDRWAERKREGQADVQEVATMDTEREYVLDRYVSGTKMAMGQKVIAKSFAEAVSKARANFPDADCEYRERPADMSAEALRNNPDRTMPLEPEAYGDEPAGDAAKESIEVLKLRDRYRRQCEHSHRLEKTCGRKSDKIAELQNKLAIEKTESVRIESLKSDLVDAHKEIDCLKEVNDTEFCAELQKRLKHAELDLAISETDHRHDIAMKNAKVEHLDKVLDDVQSRLKKSEAERDSLREALAKVPCQKPVNSFDGHRIGEHE